ncbi:type II secretion system F family protein [Micromonospora sp. H33]|uniref:type II secretion system F family protein n=1 Tax=Micromonospora sp. H33 TaxID=3452215 RepID=UPI003F893588
MVTPQGESSSADPGPSSTAGPQEVGLWPPAAAAALPPRTARALEASRLLTMPGSPDARGPRRTGPPSRRDSRRPGGPPPSGGDGRRGGTPTQSAPSATPSAAATSFRMSATGSARRGPGVAPGRRWWAGPAASPRRTLLLAGLVAAALGAVAGGPVAAFAAGAYGTVGVRGLLRREASRRARQARKHRLDQLCDLAADLRAGLPVAQAVALSTDATDGPGSSLTRAAVHLADRTGAPLAELLERIDVDARSADRGLAAAAAQAAGARATAWLLAALPLGGIGLGYGIGVDPVAVLLHTPIGGGCAVLAVVLQVAGLLWAERLTSIPGRSA